MTLPRVRFATQLAQPANLADASITVTDSAKLGGGADLVDGKTILLIHPSGEAQYVIAAGYNPGLGGNTIPITTTIGAAFAGTSPTSQVAAGNIVENDNDSEYSDLGIPPLVGATALSENEDYIIDYSRGALRALLSGLNNILAGFTLSAKYDYVTSSSKIIGLGKFLANMEVQLRLEHVMPQDGRKLTMFSPRAKISPETAGLGFTPEDWAETEWTIKVLRSFDPDWADMPLGYFKLQNDQTTLQPPTDPSKEYTAGTF